MIDYKRLKEEIDRNLSESDGYKRYCELQIPKESLSQAMEAVHAIDYDDFLNIHGLKKVSKLDADDYVTLFVDPDADDDLSNLEKLSSKLGLPIKEFYGLVQLDGDEPDANNDYDNPLPNGLATLEIKRREREIESHEASEKKEDSDTKKTVRKKDESKGTIKEVTTPTMVPSPKVATLDIMNTPIQRNRKKILSQ